MAVPGRYQRLDGAHVVDTALRLEQRIAARFPTRNLCHVAADVRQTVAGLDVAVATRSRRDRAVDAACAVGTALVIALAGGGLLLAGRDAVRNDVSRAAFDWLPVIESAVNDAVFAAVAAFFLRRIPQRRRRRRTLDVLHRLRSLAHVVDMHQLTKDPERLRPDFAPTSASPGFELTADELGRYLDYCSELLSIVAKGAALCAQAETDPVVLDTVSEIESLTAGMSRKMWQKIALLNGMAAPPG